MKAILSDAGLISSNCHRYNDPSAVISVWANEIVDKLTKIVHGNYDSDILKPIEMPLESIDTNPMKPRSRMQRNDVRPQRLVKIEHMKEEEEGDEPRKQEAEIIGIVSSGLIKEEETIQAVGMKLRPKRALKFRNDNYEDHRDNSERRSLRNQIRKEKEEPSEQRNLRNTGYSTRLQTRRIEPLSEGVFDKEECPKDNLIRIPSEHELRKAELERQTLVENTKQKFQREQQEKQEKQENMDDLGIIIRLIRKEPEGLSCDDINGKEYYFIEAIEGVPSELVEYTVAANLPSIQEEQVDETIDEMSSVKYKSKVNSGRVISLRTRDESKKSTKLDSKDSIKVVQENESGYKSRLRRPGRSLSHLYVNDIIDSEENEEEETESQGKLTRNQLKQQQKQKRKQQIHPLQELQQTEDQLEGLLRSEEHIEMNGLYPDLQLDNYEDSNPVNMKRENEFGEDGGDFESFTKIRLTLPKEQQYDNSTANGKPVLKRYNTRSARK